MNKEQVKGSIKQAAGRAQQRTGEVIHSREQQIKGVARQIEGRAQKAVGDVKQLVHQAARKAGIR